MNGAGHVTGYTYNLYTCTEAASITNTISTATYYDYILDSGSYQTDNLNGTIYVRGRAVLYVTSTLNLSGLVIQSGQSLNLYSSAPSASLVGNNSDSTADSFSFWGLPTCTSISLDGYSNFTGTIYAPSADLTLIGPEHYSADFVGASITRAVTLNGHFHFHYDEALRKFGANRGYIVTAWNEMASSEVPHVSSAP